LGCLLEIGGGSELQASRSFFQAIELKRYFVNIGLAHNLNVAVQPAAGDAALAHVQDGFPQQRGCSDRSLEISRFPRGLNPYPR
jgi:hypothetical protein